MGYMLHWKCAQYSKEATNLSGEGKENLAISYTNMGLSHANQMQHMALFGFWCKQTICKNIYKASGEIWTLTGYVMILKEYYYYEIW